MSQVIEHNVLINTITGRLNRIATSLVVCGGNEPAMHQGNFTGMAQAIPNLMAGIHDFAQQQGPHMPSPNQHLPQLGEPPDVRKSNTAGSNATDVVTRIWPDAKYRFSQHIRHQHDQARIPLRRKQGEDFRNIEIGNYFKGCVPALQQLMYWTERTLRTFF